MAAAQICAECKDPESNMWGAGTASQEATGMCLVHACLLASEVHRTMARFAAAAAWAARAQAELDEADASPRKYSGAAYVPQRAAPLYQHPLLANFLSPTPRAPGNSGASRDGATDGEDDAPADKSVATTLLAGMRPQWVLVPWRGPQLRIACAESSALAAMQAGSLETASQAIDAGLRAARLAGLPSGGRRLLLLRAEVSARQGSGCDECYAALAAAGAQGQVDGSTDPVVLASACAAVSGSESVGARLPPLPMASSAAAADSDEEDAGALHAGASPAAHQRPSSRTIARQAAEDALLRRLACIRRGEAAARAGLCEVFGASAVEAAEGWGSPLAPALELPGNTDEAGRAVHSSHLPSGAGRVDPEPPLDDEHPMGWQPKPLGGIRVAAGALSGSHAGPVGVLAQSAACRCRLLLSLAAESEDGAAEQAALAIRNQNEAMDVAEARARAASRGEGHALLPGEEPPKIVPDPVLAARARAAVRARDRHTKRATELLQAAEGAAHRAVRWFRCAGECGGASPAVATALLLLGTTRSRRIRLAVGLFKQTQDSAKDSALVTPVPHPGSDPMPAWRACVAVCSRAGPGALHVWRAALGEASAHLCLRSISAPSLEAARRLRVGAACAIAAASAVSRACRRWVGPASGGR